MAIRRAVSEVLREVRGEVREQEEAEVEAKAKDILAVKSRKAFQKYPDQPLGLVVERKLRRRRVLDQ
jgi:hypothetical protein